RCVHEVLIIASGLSVQDPRERPLDQQSQADAAHRRFIHPDSDFLTLLNIWDAFHDEVERLTQSRLRKFCRDHFLSYVRMREWRDLHGQLLDVLEERKDFQLTSAFDGVKISSSAEPGSQLLSGSPGYRSIHRAILSGLLGNVATRDEGNLYKAAHDRKASLFPGSTLFEKSGGKKDSPGNRPSSTEKKSKAPRWIVAGEIVETARVYARTAARVEPPWILELAAHVLRISHSEPFWNPEAGRVLVKQRTRLFGLEVEVKSVGYGKINPDDATEIFIREGLVNDTITWPFDFLAHNRRLREKIENVQTRMRDRGYINLEESAYRFYAARLKDPGQGISAVPELVDFVRKKRVEDSQFLFMQEGDLLPEEAAIDPAAFPDALPLENSIIPLNYSYRPGKDEDGVTLQVSLADAETLTAESLDWAVPGHVESKILHYLEALPKELRRSVVPVGKAAKEIADALKEKQQKNRSNDGSTKPAAYLIDALAEELRLRHNLPVDRRVWAESPLPDHLRVRVEVLDDSGKPLGASRNLTELRKILEQHQREISARLSASDSPAWRAARVKYERPPQTAWTFSDIPDRVTIEERAGMPVHAYLGLKTEAHGVALRMFKSPEDAQAATNRGLAHLSELQLSRDLTWLEKDLRDLRNLGALTATLVPMAELQADAFESIRRWLCQRRVNPLTESAFNQAIATAQTDLRGIVPKLIDLLREILNTRQTLLTHTSPYPGMETDLAELISAHFLRDTPFPQLRNFPRYLKARVLRCERRRQNIAKDDQRANELAPFVRTWVELKKDPTVDHGTVADFRWLLEEFRVSLFAQELGTAEPVSATKLNRFLEGLRGTASTEKTAKPATPVPLPIAPATPGKKVVFSSLADLARLKRS
ncbi:MAG TPA: DUF3418 domain-containing protein, partial [Opitutaceae bacterium]|nr:DUF3418 domain-containing protein [Opitutaceae bacterium]